jgi:nucleotide-binding universal stress UspA family protein
MDIPERLSLEIDDRIKGIVAGMKQTEFKHMEAILDHARKLLSDRFPNISLLPKNGDPSGEILHAAQAEQSDIIVVGSSGMRGVRGMLGSVARNVLGHADCSVLIGKTE